MANVKFRLRNSDKKLKTKQKIYLIYNFDSDNKLVYPTKFNVLPDHWNKKTQRVSSSEALDREEINNYLNDLEAKTERYISNLKSNIQVLSKETLKKFLDDYHNPPSTDEKTFFGFIEKFIKQQETRPTATGRKLADKTILKYNTTLRVLKEFAAQYKRKVDFDNIDMDFYVDFNAFLQKYELGKKDKETGTVKNKKTGFAVNTIGRYIATIKTFLNAAALAGITTNSFYKNRTFKVVKEESENIYLNEKELDKIFNFDFSENKRLEKVRDLFIIGAWTGLRYSDLQQLTPDKIKNGFIHIRQQKTGGKVVIPLHETTDKILKKYNNQLPRKISNDKFSVYIKEVCELAGITDEVHKALTRAGIRTSKKYKKWELVSAHTSRRSFATNLYKQNFPAVSIMAITGHKTFSSFLSYIKVTPDEHAKLLQIHWQNQNKLKVV